VERHRGDDARGRQGGREQRSDVDGLLEPVDLTEPGGERQRQQEREQDL
jgi:hypothetical protein